jgi:hypothetical protein
MAKQRNRLVMRVDEDVTIKLRQVSAALRSTEIPKVLYAGAAVMGGPAQMAAPVGATGNLRAGVYVISQYKSTYRQLSRGGRKLNSPLKSPPKPRQALVVASTFYTRFVEQGRKPRVANAEASVKRERKGVGKVRKRPFFMRTVKRVRPQAEALVEKRLIRLIEGAWQR